MAAPYTHLWIDIIAEEYSGGNEMNTNYLIAVVDDDQHIRNLVEAYLQKKITARSALAALRKLGPYGRQAHPICGCST